MRDPPIFPADMIDKRLNCFKAPVFGATRDLPHALSDLN